MNSLKNLLDLFTPNRCIHCKTIIKKETKLLCLKCFLELEFTSFVSYNNNSLEKIFYGIFEIAEAGSLFYYQKNSPIQTLLKNLKYKQVEEIGNYMAELIIIELKQSSRFKNINYVIPVPLHPKKERKRGYNQIDLFARKISKSISSEYLKDGLLKTTNNKSQTTKNKEERYNSTKHQFKINNRYNLSGTNILLVDDVITTGATLISCSKALKNFKNVNISIITIACVMH